MRTTIELRKDINIEEYQMAIRVLDAIGVLDETQKEFELTENDLLIIAKSDEDIIKNRLISSEEVQSKARELHIR